MSQIEASGEGFVPESLPGGFRLIVSLPPTAQDLRT